MVAVRGKGMQSGAVLISNDRGGFVNGPLGKPTA